MPLLSLVIQFVFENLANIINDVCTLVCSLFPCVTYGFVMEECSSACPHEHCIRRPPPFIVYIASCILCVIQSVN